MLKKLFPCGEPGCPNSRQPNHANGSKYCPYHYIVKLEEDFSRHFDSWKSYLQPDKQLRAMMGRMLEEVWQVEGAVLSMERFRDKACNFRKVRETFTFETTRRTRYFRGECAENRVIQTWRVDVSEGVVKFVSERDLPISDVSRQLRS
jgi:hypothetical protein